MPPATTPPAMATSGRPGPPWAVWGPKTPHSTRPSTAPGLMPMRVGSTSGLISTVWSIAPASPSIAPAVMAMSARGSRSCPTIAVTTGSAEWWISAATTSEGANGMLPTPTPSTSSTGMLRARANAATRHRRSRGSGGSAVPASGRVSGGAVIGELS